MADVTFQHGDYAENYDAWEMVEDACAGNPRSGKGVKSTCRSRTRPTKAQQTSSVTKQYKARAVYYNVTRRTLQSLTGACFPKTRRLPSPPLLAYVNTDIDGQGLSICQQSQVAVSKSCKGPCRHPCRLPADNRTSHTCRHAIWPYPVDCRTL